jgi:hypothetical protein
MMPMEFEDIETDEATITVNVRAKTIEEVYRLMTDILNNDIAVKQFNVTEVKELPLMV